MKDKKIKDSNYPILSKYIFIEEVKEENNNKIYFVLEPNIPSWLYINEDGLEILKLCNGKNSIKKISLINADKYHIKYNESFEIITDFLDNVKNNYLLYEKPIKEIKNNQFRGLALEITRKCNLKCIHCYLSAGKAFNDELKLSEIKELINSITDLGGTSIAFGGGEPFLRNDFIEMIEYAASLDLLISVGTNGTLIDKRLAKILSNLPIKLQISLDGATKVIHDRIRGEGSFDQTIRGINNLIAEGMEKDIVIAFTPMKINFNETSDIINFALERKIPVIQFPPLSPSGRAKKRWSDLRLSDHEILRFWDFISKRSKELRGRMDLLADCFSIDINNKGIKYRCSIGTQLRVDPEGYVYPCQCFHYGSTYCLGNIREKSLKNILYSKKLKEIKDICFQRPSKIDECIKCKWRNYCGSGCMGIVFEKYGTILQPESCKVRKRWIEKMFKAKITYNSGVL